MDLPFPLYNYLYKHLNYFITNDETKHTINDPNRVPYVIRYNKEVPYLVAVGDENGYIKLFKTDSVLKMIKEENIHKNCIYDLIWLNKNKIACGGGDKTVSIVDMNSIDNSDNNVITTLKGHTESVKSLTMCKTNENIIATGSRDASILIYDLRFNKRISDNSHHSINNILCSHFTNINNKKQKCPISCILFKTDNYLLSTSATDNLIKLWDIRKIYSNRSIEPTPLSVYDNKYTSKGYSNIQIDNSNRYLYANCMNNQIYKYDLLTNNICLINNNQVHKVTSNYVKICLSPCYNYLLTGSSDFNSYIYPLKYSNLLNIIKLKAHINEVTSIDWCPYDINQLITCSDDNTIRLWNIKRDSNHNIEEKCDFRKAQEVVKTTVDDNNSDYLILDYDFEYNYVNKLSFYNNNYLFNSYYLLKNNNYYKNNNNSKMAPIINYNNILISNDANINSNNNNNNNNISQYKCTINLPKKLNQHSSLKFTPKSFILEQTNASLKTNGNTQKQNFKLENEQKLEKSASRKRTFNKIFTEALNLNEATPSNKRRLIMDTTNKNKQTTNSKSITILDYFSPKLQQKNL